MIEPRRVAAIVLAAGLSRRFGYDNKLLQPLGTKTVVATTVAALMVAGADPIIVVTGHDAAAIGTAVDGFGTRCIHNPNFADGMGGSIAVGARELTNDNIAGAIIALGDMPYVKAETIAALIDALDAPDDIIVPTMDGRPGNPVLFGGKYLASLAACSGDVGAKAVLLQAADALKTIETGDPNIFQDIDRPEDLSD